ncbi:hypothetical protein ACOMHN_036276 [Nucella lapillus]
MGGGQPPGATRGRRTSMGGGQPPGATRGGGPQWEEDRRQGPLGGEEDRCKGPLGGGGPPQGATRGRRIARTSMGGGSPPGATGGRRTATGR